MYILDQIYSLENNPNIRRYDDSAEYWYVFEDVLHHVFRLEHPASWIARIKLKPTLWQHLFNCLTEFSIENPETKLKTKKYCITEYKLWLFLFSIPQFKALNCSHQASKKIRQKHERLDIDSAEWNLRIKQLGTEGKLYPTMIKVTEDRLISRTAKLRLRTKQKYESLSKIDRWLHDLMKHTVSQALKEAARPEDFQAFIQENKKSMKKFSQIIKNDLRINF